MRGRVSLNAEIYDNNINIRKMTTYQLKSSYTFYEIMFFRVVGIIPYFYIVIHFVAYSKQSEITWQILTFVLRSHLQRHLSSRRGMF